MSGMTRLTLMFVVFVDLIGQGLVFPIVNALIMEPGADFLPESTSLGTREFYYGLVIGTFFLAWFLGVVYIARLSDSIGRKNALLICLGGALVGYALTIAALYLDSLWLLILGRAITGFTAGNQPIAQAAVIDGSRDPIERDRNMGYLVTGISLGLVGGPIIGGLLSDKQLLGDIASLNLPFYAALVMTAAAMLLVTFFFSDFKTQRERFVFRPRDIVDGFVRIAKFPIVMRIMPVYALLMLTNLTIYVFLDNYLTAAFGYGEVGGSVAMVTIGAAIAIAGTFLVKWAQVNFGKQQIVGATLVVMAVCAIAAVLSPVAWAIFPAIFVFYLFFGVAYPTLLGIFSSSVEPKEQGWVMGITTATFCLEGGIMSLIGGGLMSIDMHLPYVLGAIFALLGFATMLATWRTPVMRGLTARATAAQAA
jgi:DHA1 family tetracycline resistance protein-like MFS transporter